MNTSSGARLSLEWRETGVRVVDTNPKHNGFGRELIERGLPYELGATTSLEFGPGGARARVEVPLNDRISQLDEDDRYPEAQG